MVSENEFTPAALDDRERARRIAGEVEKALGLAGAVKVETVTGREDFGR